MFSSIAPAARILASSSTASHLSPTAPTGVWQGAPPGTAASATSCGARSDRVAALKVLLKNRSATGSALTLHLPMEIVDFNFNQFKSAPCNSMMTNTSHLIFFFFLYLCCPQNFWCCGCSVLVIYILPVLFDRLGAHLQFAMPFDGTSDMHIKVRFGVRALLICDTVRLDS
jgi:hypothetical protein